MRAEIARVSPLKNEPLDANVPKIAGLVVDAYEFRSQVVLSLENSSLSSRHSESLQRTRHWVTQSSECTSCHRQQHSAESESRWNLPDPRPQFPVS